VSLRPSIVAAVLLAFVMQLPVTARAQEVAATTDTSETRDAPAVTAIATPIPIPIPIPNVLTLHLATRPALPPSSLLARTPEDIRLSHGAKVAIIVSAIVVGSLLVLGLVVYGTRPGHL
jgi:hypothetical protein